MKNLKHITEICRELYDKSGFTTTMNYIDEQIKKGNPAYKDVKYFSCSGCESETPHWKDMCLVCGTGNDNKK